MRVAISLYADSQGNLFTGVCYKHIIMPLFASFRDDALTSCAIHTVMNICEDSRIYNKLVL